MNWRRVARDTLIVWLATGLGGLAVGFSFGLLGATQSPKFMMAIGFANMLFSVVAFAIVGILTKDNRFRHLLIVMLASWVASFVNVVFFGFTIRQWIFSLPLSAVLMLVGGGIALLIAKFSSAGNSENAT